LVWGCLQRSADKWANSFFLKFVERANLQPMRAKNGSVWSRFGAREAIFLQMFTNYPLQ
jgi:hypothetical protein